MKNILISVTAMCIFLTSCKKDTLNSDLSNNELHPTGAVLTKPELYAAIPEAKITVASSAASPSVMMLAMPPVGNQGSEGSCVAWSCTYAARSQNYASASNASSFSNGANVFSPEYVYNQIKFYDCQSGSCIYDAMNLMLTQGVCTWEAMPYVNGYCDVMPTPEQVAQAANYKIKGYGTTRINSANFKKVLNSGKAIIVAGPVNMAFQFLSNGSVLNAFTGNTQGYHSYCIMGYDDSKQAFKFQNSWGTGWGSAGYGWISYNNLSDWVSEAYVLN